MFTDNRKFTEESKKTQLVKFQANIDTLNSDIVRDSTSYEEKKNLIAAQRKTLMDKVPLIEDHMKMRRRFITYKLKSH